MLIARRLAAYLVAFFGLLLLILFTDSWRGLDYLVYRAVYLDRSDEVLFDDDIVVIDIPGEDGNSNQSLEAYRKRIADLLQQIASKGGRPEAVVLDFTFDDNDVGVEALSAAIKAVQDIDRVEHGEEVDVFRVLDLKNALHGVSREEVMERHARELYKEPHLSAHTVFTESLGILSYDAQFPLTVGTSTEHVPAMPISVAKSLNKAFVPERSAYVLPIGPRQHVRARTYSFIHAGGTTSGGRFTAPREKGSPPTAALPGRTLPALGGKMVLIGSLLEDQPNCATCTQSGPELLAWAISDQRAKTSVARAPLDNNLLILVQIVALGVFTVLMYALLFKYVRRLQTKPVVLALVSIALGIAALVGLSGVALALDTVIPVGMTLVSIVLAGALSSSFAYRFLVTGVAEGAGKYDVFISYSHADSDWVIKHVYEPLRALKRLDGESLEIFFDRNSIGLGEAFTAKYMWSIVDSKVFLPIFSEGYYAKNHCRNEMDVAYKRSVEKLITILPIVHGGQIPAIYSHINYVEAKDNPDFMRGVKRAIVGEAAAAKAFAAEEHASA